MVPLPIVMRARMYVVRDRIRVGNSQRLPGLNSKNPRNEPASSLINCDWSRWWHKRLPFEAVLDVDKDIRQRAVPVYNFGFIVNGLIVHSLALRVFIRIPLSWVCASVL